MGYSNAMNTLVLSPEFDAWLNELRDDIARVRIVARLRMAEGGNFGDCEPVGEGVSEMRIHVGAGYRVYYTKRGNTVYVVLMGGDKATQQKDIKRAKKMAAQL